MTTRRANGDGSCRRITEGRFTGKWRVQLTLTDSKGSKRRISRLFPTQAEGKAFIRDVQRDIHRSEAEAAKPVTLSDWFFWLVENDWPDTVADSTIRSRIGRFRKDVEREWGGSLQVIEGFGGIGLLERAAPAVCPGEASAP